MALNKLPPMSVVEGITGPREYTLTTTPQTDLPLGVIAFPQEVGGLPIFPGNMLGLEVELVAESTVNSALTANYIDESATKIYIYNYDTSSWDEIAWMLDGLVAWLNTAASATNTATKRLSSGSSYMRPDLARQYFGTQGPFSFQMDALAHANNLTVRSFYVKIRVYMG